MTRLLRQRNMQLLMAGSFAAMFNLYVALTALPVHIVQVGGTVFHAGLLSSIGIFSQIAFRFIFGPMTDSRGRRLPLLFGSAAFMLAPAGYLLADSVVGIGVVRVFQAIGPAALLSAGSALAIDLSPPSLRATGLGMLSTVKSLGVALGPPIALAIAATAGFTTVFWLGIGLGIIGFVSIWFLQEPRTGTTDFGDDGSAYTYNERWAAVLSPAPSKIALPSLAVLTVAYGAVLTFVPLYGEQLGVTHHGVYFTILALASMVGGLVTGMLADRYGRIPVLLPVIGVYAVGFALLFGFASPWLAAWSAIFVGAGFLGNFVLFGTMMDDVVGSDHRGLVFAAQENGVDLGMGLGALAFGIIVERTGYGLGFLILGLLCIAWGGVTIPFLRRLRSQSM